MYGRDNEKMQVELRKHITIGSSNFAKSMKYDL